MLTKVFKNGSILVQILLLLMTLAAIFGVMFTMTTSNSIVELSFLDVVVGGDVNIPYKVDVILSIALVIFTSTVLYFMLVNNGLGKRGSCLTILIYLILMSQSKLFLILSPMSFIMPMIVWVLSMIFSLSKHTAPQNTVLGLSILIAISSLLYVPMLFVILIAWIGVVSFNTLNVRLFIVSLLGFMTPLILTHSILFAFGNTAVLSSFLKSTSDMLFLPPNYDVTFFIQVATYLLLIISISKIYSTRSDHTVDTRRKFNLLLSTVIVAITGTILFPSTSEYSFMLAIIPISILLGFLFQYAKHTLIQELILTAIFIVSLCNNYIIS